MALTETPLRRRRAPNGVLSDKPIGLRLSRSERDHLEQYAESEARSLAAFARSMCLRGLKAYVNDQRRAQRRVPSFHPTARD